MEIRIIVAGGRDFNDSSLFESKMDSIMKDYLGSEIVSGHASGVDSMAECYAKNKGYELSIFPAEWKKYGRAAGPIRNKEMLDYIMEKNPVLIAFWDGKSKGTKDMIDRAMKSNVKCHVVRY